MANVVAVLHTLETMRKFDIEQYPLHATGKLIQFSVRKIKIIKYKNELRQQTKERENNGKQWYS